MGAMNVGQSAPFLEAMNVARGAAANIFDILERESKINPISEEGMKPQKFNGYVGAFVKLLASS